MLTVGVNLVVHPLEHLGERVRALGDDALSLHVQKNDTHTQTQKHEHTEQTNTRAQYDTTRRNSNNNAAVVLKQKRKAFPKATEMHEA